MTDNRNAISERQQRVAALFRAALEHDGSQRARFLHEQCGDDQAILEEVEALLSADAAATGFLEPPGTAVDREGPGATIGRYTLLKPIGEGGFGVVYLAEQREPVHRQVALKIIKLGMDTRQVIARFETERQALAMMDHPNIAKVLDAGATDTGRPYFVMELARGDNITDYCDRERLPIRQRLELFRQVCAAVQHAHQKGIIHRDMKPSNVLVTMVDGTPVPKVIDFGIAKATAGRLTERAAYTEQHQLLGTPQYMSPEQAAGSPNDIDTRSDIYSLGVLLYELLTGTTPFDSLARGGAAMSDIQRIIREVGPRRPSTRLSTLDTLPEIAARRQIEPRKLEPLIRGDLDWIVMKCLEKDRARRYVTVNGLAQDIGRHLGHEPVEAGPPGPIYRIHKLIQRNRVAVFAGLFVSVALVLGVIGTSAGMIWALGERSRADDALRSESEQREAAQVNEHKARREAARASAALNLLGEMLQQPRTRDESGKPLPFQDHLRHFAASLESRVSDEPKLEAEVRFMLGKVLASVDDHAAAEEQFARVLSLRRMTLGELDPAVSSVLWHLAGAVLDGGNGPRATDIALDAVNQARTFVAEHLEVAERLHLLAQVQFLAGDCAAGETSAQEGLQMRLRLLEPHHVLIAGAHSQLAAISSCRRRWAEAERHYRAAAAVYRVIEGERSAGATAQEIRLAQMMRSIRDYPRSVQIASETVGQVRTALAEAHSESQRLRFAEQLDQLGQLLVVTEDGWELAESVSREALSIRRELRASDPLAFARGTSSLAGILWCRGEYAEAEQLCREAMRIARTSDQRDFQFRIAVTASLLQLILRDGGGDLAEAQALAEETLAASRRAHPEPYWTVWMLEYELAAILRMRGNDAEARQLEQHAAAMVPKAGAHRSFGVALRCQRVGTLLMSRSEYELAEPMLAERERILRDIWPHHWQRFDAMSALGECLAAQDRFEEAETMLLESVEHLRHDAATPSDRQGRGVARVIELYDAWNAAEPEAGHDAQAAEWRSRLGESDSPPSTD